MNAKNKKIVRIRDLRQLGLEGGAVATLENSSQVSLKKDVAIENIRGYVQGEIRDLKLRVGYKELYPRIQTITRHDVLVAKRSQSGQLILTGQGFTRKEKRK
ncbi:hypothetical protein [Streptococcus danieliae]|uniref:Uncharacterized protein n=1 Tax=Streptococcus danieliae TaxID=747656 RepID=A0A7Z0M8B3_9STRE|nr:hypothetical protein [Streptococcus danieliae]MBF0700159.1 hypothetical protein [Streptococcus danieliae]NYS97335.1 hypothetical protein [Streptococcus danieliae]